MSDLAERQSEDMRKYKADVAKKWAKAKKPNEMERALIDAIYPGYREPVEFMIDIAINESALKQARKTIEALKPWLKDEDNE